MREMGSINIYDIYADVCVPRGVRLPAATLGAALMDAAPAAALGFRVAALHEISGARCTCAG